MEIAPFLKNKTAGLPNGVWILGGVAVVFFFYFKHKQSAAAAASGNPNMPGQQPGQFSTSTTTTNPTTGDQTTYTASGPNSSIYSPAQLTYSAGPMPYSGGDVYVNYPGQPTAPTPYNGPPYPPAHATPAPPGHEGSFWLTLPKAMTGDELVNYAYQTGGNLDPTNVANDEARIRQFNPQINWAGGAPVPAGSAVYIPLALWGDPNTTYPLPPGGSQNAPPGYTPPQQQTAMPVYTGGDTGPANWTSGS